MTTFGATLRAVDVVADARPVRSVPLTGRTGTSVGAMLLAEQWPGEDRYSGSRLAGLLRHLGSAQVARRVPLHLDNDDRAATVAGLIKFAETGLNDPAWVELNGRDGDDPPRPVLLLSEEQARFVAAERGVKQVHLILANDQPVCGGQLGSHGDAVHDKAFLPYSANPLAETYGPQPDGWRLQTYSTALLGDEKPSKHVLRAVLSKEYRGAFGRKVGVLSNPDLESAYPKLDTRVRVAITFSTELENWAAAVDEAALIAAGLRTGEPCHVRPEPVHAHGHPRWTLRYRHVVARVAPAMTLDQERPLCRMPVEVLNLLGVRDGDPVKVNSLGARDGDHGKQAGLRALEFRPPDEPFRPLRGGAPDYFDETGNVDLPSISIDAASQAELSVRRGSTVYVRPPLMILLSRELNAVLLLVLAALIGTLADELLVAAAVLAGIVLLAASAVVVLRLRQ